MINKENGILTVTCDKCGTEQSCPENDQSALHDSGWSVNPSGKKYKQVCYICHTKKQRGEIDFVRSKFSVTNK